MFLLRYYRFQIRSHICHALSHYPFRNIYLQYARASEASERSESSCIFISHERTYVTSKVRFISQYTLFFEQYHLQVDVKAKISLCHYCLMNYVGISLLSLILTFSAHFYHCRYIVIVEVMFPFMLCTEMTNMSYFSYMRMLEFPQFFSE